jgi:hypothetical protein
MDVIEKEPQKHDLSPATKAAKIVHVVTRTIDGKVDEAQLATENRRMSTRTAVIGIKAILLSVHSPRIG